MNQLNRLNLSSTHPLARSVWLTGLAILTGCAPAIETSSLPIPNSAITSSSASLDLQKAVSPSVQPTHFEQLTENPPFVYRVVEATPRTDPLFITTIRSCGSLKPHTPLSSLRILFSGLSTVRITKGPERNIGTQRVAINEGVAMLDKQPIFLRVFSVPPSGQKRQGIEKSKDEEKTQSDCLTDHVVWSSSDNDLTERSVAAFNHLSSIAPLPPTPLLPPLGQ